MKSYCFLLIFLCVSVYAELDRYPVFGIGESREIARGKAVSRAEKIAKQTGKKYSVYGENYSKFSGGIFWKCRLDVSFHHKVAVVNIDRYPVLGRGYSQELARSAAVSRAEKIAKQTGKKYSVYGEKYSKLSGGRIWICRLDVSFHNLDHLAVEDNFVHCTAVAEQQKEARSAAMDELQSYGKELQRDFHVVGERYYKIEKQWLCIIEASFAEIEHKTLILSLTNWGKTKEEARKNIAAVEDDEVLKSYTIISEEYSILRKDLWQCTVKLRLD